MSIHSEITIAVIYVDMETEARFSNIREFISNSTSHSNNLASWFTTPQKIKVSLRRTNIMRSKERRIAKRIVKEQTDGI